MAHPSIRLHCARVRRHGSHFFLRCPTRRPRTFSGPGRLHPPATLPGWQFMAAQFIQSEVLRHNCAMHRAAMSYSRYTIRWLASANAPTIMVSSLLLLSLPLPLLQATTRGKGFEGSSMGCAARQVAIQEAASWESASQRELVGE